MHRFSVGAITYPRLPLLLVRRRSVFLLLWLISVVLLKPSGGAPFQVEEIGSLASARYLHTATVLSQATSPSFRRVNREQRLLFAQPRSWLRESD
jgi:hypothetical protein